MHTLSLTRRSHIQYSLRWKRKLRKLGHALCSLNYLKVQEIEHFPLAGLRVTSYRLLHNGGCEVICQRATTILSRNFHWAVPTFIPCKCLIFSKLNVSQLRYAAKSFTKHLQTLIRSSIISHDIWKQICLSLCDSWIWQLSENSIATETFL